MQGLPLAGTPALNTTEPPPHVPVASLSFCSWLAPCVLSGLPGQLAADVWSFGTVRFVGRDSGSLTAEEMESPHAFCVC